MRACGELETADSPAPAWLKAQRLANALVTSKAILLLDGVETLLEQSPWQESQAHRLVDDGLRSLFVSLMQQERPDAFCVITSRLEILDVAAYEHRSAIQKQLQGLDSKSSLQLLRHLGIKASDEELRKLAQDLGYHPLSLELIGSALRNEKELLEWRATYDERKPRASSRLESLWEWYDKHLAAQTDAFATERRELMYAISIFDRPVQFEILSEVVAGAALSGITERLHNVSEKKLRELVQDVAKHRLLTMTTDRRDTQTVSAHPLVREHFYKKAYAESPSSVGEIHRRLFRYYANWPVPENPSRYDLEPYYLAVFHGAKGLLTEEAFRFYYERIQRKEQLYAAHTLGAVSSNLSTLGHFYKARWSRLARGLSSESQAWILSDTGMCLARLDNLEECFLPLERAVRLWKRIGQFRHASIVGGMLAFSAIENGELERAVEFASEAVHFSRQSHDKYHIALSLRCLGDVFHHIGRIEDAAACFGEADTLVWSYQAAYPYLLAQSEYRAVDFYTACGAFRAARNSLRRLSGFTQNELKGSRYAAAIHLMAASKLALAAYQSGRVATLINEVVERLDKAIKILESVDVRQFRVRALLTQARALTLLRNFNLARVALTTVHSECDRAHDKLHACDVDLERTRLDLEERDKPEWIQRCLTSVRNLIARATTMHYRRLLPNLFALLSNAELLLGQNGKAKESYAKAETLCQEMRLSTHKLELRYLKKILAHKS